MSSLHEEVFSLVLYDLFVKPEGISSLIIKNMPLGVFYNKSTYIIIQGILAEFKYKMYLNEFTDG